MKVLLLTGKIPCKYDQKFNSSLVSRKNQIKRLNLQNCF